MTTTTNTILGRYATDQGLIDDLEQYNLNQCVDRTKIYNDMLDTAAMALVDNLDSSLVVDTIEEARDCIEYDINRFIQLDTQTYNEILECIEDNNFKRLVVLQHSQSHHYIAVQRQLKRYAGSCKRTQQTLCDVFEYRHNTFI